jgi:hypothetical protein
MREARREASRRSSCNFRRDRHARFVAGMDGSLFLWHRCAPGAWPDVERLIH